jgi:hypothetical protein
MTDGVDGLEYAAITVAGRRFGGRLPAVVMVGDAPRGLVAACRRQGNAFTVVTMEDRSAEFGGRPQETYLRGDIVHLLPELDFSGPTVVFARRSIGWRSFMRGAQTLARMAEFADDRLIVCLELLGNANPAVDPAQAAKPVHFRATELDDQRGFLLRWWESLCSYDREDVASLASYAGLELGVVRRTQGEMVQAVLWRQGAGVPAPVPKYSAREREIGLKRNRISVAAWEAAYAEVIGRSFAPGGQVAA